MTDNDMPRTLRRYLIKELETVKLKLQDGDDEAALQDIIRILYNLKNLESDDTTE